MACEPELGIHDTRGRTGQSDSDPQRISPAIRERTLPGSDRDGALWFATEGSALPRR